MMLTIRKVTQNDLKQVEYICRMTAGELSQKDEKVGNLIAKIYSTYYVRAESDTCFVLDDNGKAVGYILCAPDQKRFQKGYRQNEVKVISALDRGKGIFAWFLPLAYLPFRKHYPAHMHIDLLEGYRSGGNGTRMVQTLLDHLREKGVPGVMLICGTDNTGAQRFYARNGFQKKLSAFGGTVMVKRLK